MDKNLNRCLKLLHSTSIYYNYLIIYYVTRSSWSRYNRYCSLWICNLTLWFVVCTAIAGLIILMSCQVGSGCVRGRDQPTHWTIPPLRALMSYCTCGHSTAPAVTMTTRCHWLPPAPATEHASIQSTPTGTHTHTNLILDLIQCADDYIGGEFCVCPFFFFNLTEVIFAIEKQTQSNQLWFQH